MALEFKACALSIGSDSVAIERRNGGKANLSRRDWEWTLCNDPAHLRTNRTNAEIARDWLATPFRLIELASGNGTCSDGAC